MPIMSDHQGFENWLRNWSIVFAMATTLLPLEQRRLNKDDILAHITLKKICLADFLFYKTFSC